MTHRPRDPGEFCWINIIPPHPAAAAAREALRLGATVYLAVQEAAGVGRLCGIRSPQGVQFLVIAVRSAGRVHSITSLLK